MPNAGGTGYYRWNLSSEGWQDLRKSGLAHLSVEEQLTVIDSIEAAFAAGTISASNTLQVLEPFAASSTREIAMSPALIFSFFADYLLDPAHVEVLRAKGRQWYRPAYEKFRFDESKSEPDDAKLFRAQVIEFLAFEARDLEVRREARKRGRATIGFGTDRKLHPEAVGSNLVETVLGVAVQDEEIAFIDDLIRMLKESNESLLRSQILSALGRATEPAKVQKILALSLDPALRTNEVLSPFEDLSKEKENWDPVWKFLVANFDALVARVSPSDAGSLSTLASVFCSEQKAVEVNEFFEKRMEKLVGGNRNLTRTVDAIRVCAAKAEHHRRDAFEIK
ncbi:ERAP1-like C-terminal domain-containing protein [bacterium]|nr:ERAP1-like C-terminal domain-containing protein [bacterium]